MATPRFRWGERLGRRFEPVAEQQRPLNIGDLSQSVTSDYFIERMREIEAQVEDTIRNRLKMQGRISEYHYDPFKMHLGMLESAERDKILAEISNLLGAEHFLNNLNQGPTMIRDYVDELGRDERSPAGVFKMTPEAIAADPRAAYLSQTTFRFLKSRAVETPAENYLPAATLPRIENILTNQERLANFISRHGKTLVLDVESASLDPKQGIWQYAAQLVDENGNAGDVKTFYFDNLALRHGLVQDESSHMVRLDKYLLKGRAGDEEANWRAIFKMAEGAENVAGHNVMFDYKMMAAAIRKSKAYRQTMRMDQAGQPTYTGFAEEAEAFLSKFKPETVFDTSVLARMVLPHMELAQELKGGANAYRFSLSNLLLQTNLSQYFSPEELEQAVNQGLHYANIDVPFESKLLHALHMHQTGELPIQLGNQFLTGDLRTKVARSAPIGPNIEMVDENLYHAALRDVGPLSPMQQMSIRSRNMTLRAKAMGSTTDDDLTQRVGAQERTIGSLSKRNILSRDLRYLNADAEIPDPQEWYQIQQELADRGVPLPGLSLVERHISSMLSSIGGPNMGRLEESMRELAGPDVMGLGRFIEAERARVVGQRNKIVVLPLKYLKNWEAEMRAGGHAEQTTNFLKGVQMLGMSPFEYPQPGAPDAQWIKEVGLNVQLPKEQLQTLAEHLSRQPEFQDEAGDKLLTQIVRAFEDASGTYGIQVGTLGGIKGHSRHASKLYDILKSYQGVGAGYSDQTPMFHTAYAATGEELANGPEQVYTAGAFLRGDLLSNRERSSLVDQITSMVTDYGGAALSKRKFATMQMLKGLKRDPRSQAEATRALETTKKIFKVAPYVALATVVAAGGYYAYRRHEQNQQIDATFAPMPAEPQGWSKQNYYQAVPYNPRRDPHSYLDTANVVSNLDDNKINHTNMNQQQKYSYLFTGGGYSS